MHAQHVAVELGGDARGVVVGGHEPARVLHQVGAEQERVARLEPAATLGEELGALRRGRGCRSCRRGRRPAGGPRRAAAPRWCSKSPTTPCTLDARVRRGDRRRWRRAASPRSRRRARSAAASRRGKRVEQQAGLRRRARAQLDQRVGAARGRDLVGPRARGSPARVGWGSTRAAG